MGAGPLGGVNILYLGYRALGSMYSCEVWLECSKELVRYRMKTLLSKFNDLTLKTGVKVKKKISSSEKMLR